ncbi:TPA: hypothetical protein DEQ22_00780 [Candidatus Nomurabacteria bacterium]|uniref:Uncharacterized protein n=2 Tax=Candidatus Nomuraibacteriota TaxID=1752729 RepID=A0A1F6YQ75_9BACT|nr:MAG: hypothetical protein UV13_C0002G0002 [Parcubacteria group bacterium GW2011_GWC1_42_21]KKS58647.1 MAG: hypothetical protein UV23_C0003G0031 [Candidatus Nomurabacteria bacterium GW2011_GWF1_42_40]KKT00410.1 MAG: hypothetical protein UV77_C0004G0042 [Candidatus Nomurabacteria bacterium GW2011_GWA1_43_17]KKT11363.1 MAG: hypothetical protein UV91_C0007G0063 [Candidatus Nomurabacteria bacterium GW2011_GWF2_43_24]KKT17943.1 MAG: hypothetical protein UW01_C0007G0041 [Candidatus Nomurabacteria b
MKKILVLVILLAAIAGIFYFANKPAVAPGVTLPAQSDPVAEKANVESYLRENISILSPIPAVLGGTWYVVEVTVNTDTDSGTVEYEDGHINEKRNFSYTTTGKVEVAGLTIE